MMSATQRAIRDRRDDPEESSSEDSGESPSVHEQTHDKANFQGTVTDANTARECETQSKFDNATAGRNKHTTSELQSPKDKQGQQQNSSIQGQNDPIRLTHTQSLHAGHKNMSSYAQRRCDELKEKLDAAELANSLLRENISLEEEKNMGLVDQANAAQKAVGDLEVALLAHEEDYKALIGKFKLLEGEAKQSELDHASKERESARLVEQIEDLKDDNEELLEEKKKIQTAYENCCAKLDRKRKEALDSSEKATQYLYQRNENKKRIEELVAENDRLTLGNAHLKRRLQEAGENRNQAEENELKFKEAARVWKSKYNKTLQEKNDEIQKGSRLAEEISTLRHANAIQDDPSLRDDLASFKYTVRDWCDRILECKPTGISAHFEEFPLENEGPAFLTDLGEKELNVLIASVWEWLIKLVFGYEGYRKDNPGHPDLWLENEKRFCLNFLEQYFGSKDPAVATQWRHRTVQQLVDSDLCTGDQRFHDALEDIMKWITKSLKLASPTPQLEMLKVDFETQVLRGAVDFALKLRRQNSEINLVIPRTMARGLRSIALARTLKTPDSEQNMLKVCIGPQVRKVIHQYGTREILEEVILEAEFTDVPFRRWISEGVCSCDTAQQAEDIEVD